MEYFLQYLSFKFFLKKGQKKIILQTYKKTKVLKKKLLHIYIDKFNEVCRKLESSKREYHLG